MAFGIQGDNEKGWTDVEAASAVAEINYIAPMRLGVLLAEKLRAQGHGHLVVMSSPAGERARRSNFVYGSSKAGLDVFYTGLTYVLSDAGVKVTVVRPHFVHTKLTAGMKPPPMAQTPQQVASAIVDGVQKGKEEIYAPPHMRWVRWPGDGEHRGGGLKRALGRRAAVLLPGERGRAVCLHSA